MIAVWLPTLHALGVVAPVYVSISALTMAGLLFVLCLAERRSPRS